MTTEQVQEVTGEVRWKLIGMGAQRVEIKVDNLPTIVTLAPTSVEVREGWV